MSEKRVDIFNLLKNEGKLETILVYSAQEIQLDPYEHNTEKKFNNPLPIKGLVRDISVEALKWSYYGNIPIGSKEIICQKKYKSLFLTANKIKIGEDYFKTYHDDQKGFGLLERQDYIVVILERKNE